MRALEVTARELADGSAGAGGPGEGDDAHVGMRDQRLALYELPRYTSRKNRSNDYGFDPPEPDARPGDIASPALTAFDEAVLAESPRVSTTNHVEVIK